MIFRHPDPRRPLWDSWLFEDSGFHLFYLLMNEPGEIGHAWSEDLVHWSYVDTIPLEGPAGSWDARGGLTGYTVKRDGVYYLFYGSAQKVGLMTSTDMRNWSKHPVNPVIVPSAPHYRAEPGEVFSADWRDPHIEWLPDAQCYEALLCARQPDPPLGSPLAPASPGCTRLTSCTGMPCHLSRALETRS